MSVRVVVVAENQLGALCAAVEMRDGRRVLFVRKSCPVLTAIQAYLELKPTEPAEFHLVAS